MNAQDDFDFTPYREIVAAAMSEVGLDPAECYDEEGQYYSLVKGSASLYIGFSTNFYDDGYVERYIYFSGYLSKVPVVDREAFYRRLLEEAWTRIGVKFYVTNNDEAWVEISRDIEGLDLGEVRANMERVANTTDYLDDVLKAEFNCPA
ncbi:MAG: YbjN domain-containing protein [bacterium]|nr:YbjN domain-containing protein [bacterium]